MTDEIECPTCDEHGPADTITNLRAEVERLREALERIIDRSMNDPIGTSKVIDMREIARATLTQTKGTTDDA